MTTHLKNTSSQISELPYRWDRLLRYRLIEIISLWEGRLISNHLMDAFGIGRQQASNDINDYKEKVGPGNLIYDTQVKGYVPTDRFKPKLTQGNVDEYLYLVNTKRDLCEQFESLNMALTNSMVIHSPNRAIKPHFIRPIIKAAREKMRIELAYASLTSEQAEYRVITPHTLVYSGYRWHVRAHCEKHGEYRDFVLSRIKDIPDPVTPSENGIENDTAWNTEIILWIIPDPRLEPYQKRIIEDDFQMQDGRLPIKTRAALATYYLQFLRIDKKTILEDPLQQQLVLENRDEVEKWLFG